MEIICDFCKNPFNYKRGIAHYSRSKYHYCGQTCLTAANTTHGLSVRKMGKSDKRYQMWCSAAKRAKQKGIEFTITINDIPEIPLVCPVLGIEIIANTTHAPLDTSPSLDRIDSTNGYIPGNIRIISNRANRIKADATLEELELIVKDLKTYEVV